VCRRGFTIFHTTIYNYILVELHVSAPENFHFKHEELHVYAHEYSYFRTNGISRLHTSTYILHSWNYTCVHMWIYIFAHVDVHFCTGVFTRICIFAYVVLHLCAHVDLHSSHIVLYLCTCGIKRGSTRSFIFYTRGLHVCVQVDLRFWTRDDTRVCRRWFALSRVWFTILHTWNYVLTHVELHGCAHIELQFQNVDQHLCPRGIKDVWTREYIFLHTSINIFTQLDLYFAHL
jgi:hypothetical protein